ncbi:MAG: alpha/beta hydrolase [Candidatus Omnitrophica bacterium]|nr:alpha/beta hydrolase [Candidatus Omnitrophota bacterium]MCB9783503.1 alpha/beta hydrolase [Candidatus Omnitrophota bacterium]
MLVIVEWSLVIFFFVLVSGSLYGFWKMIGATTKIFLDLPIQLPYQEAPHLPGERVTFEATDGVTLPGLLIRSPKSDGRTVLFAPEFGADLGSYEKYAGHLIDAGFHLFAIEFRGHGPIHVSEGYIPTHWPTRYEVYDLLGAIDFLAAQKDVDGNRIALFGVSKGACIAICAAAKVKKIAAVISDSAFSTKITALQYIERWGPIFIRSDLFWRMMPKWFLVLLRNFSLALSGKLRGCTFISVSDYLKKWSGAPIFFIHGERDSYIPADQVEILKSWVSQGETETWIVPKARHNESAVVAREEYQRRTVEFLDKHLPLAENGK